ncbi:MAG TPA: type II 3-dehydroquinate dehydratase, partial [Thermomicrobiales bacterium]|nr:type II 3-dehydroquinate dehydratase [Thermomicrobiales bacterium]
MRILVINGPNLNMLGTREPDKYGTKTLPSIIANLRDQGAAATPALEILDFQSNHEGAIVDFLQTQAGEAGGIIINAGAFTHYSYAIRDAVVNTGLPTVEVHITNIHARETFRHHSVISDIVAGQVVGLGWAGYGFALEWHRQRLDVG